jgi:hypothetical protein
MDELATQRVLTTGWAYFAGHIPDPVCALVRKPDAVNWKRLAPQVGVVSQDGWFAQLRLGEAPEPVQALGRSIYESVSKGTGSAFPAFNEVTWQRYDPGSGFIAPHRDQANYVGIIAVITLSGQAEFAILESRSPAVVSDRWLTGEGHLVVLRGADLVGAGSRGPLHRVGPPDTERLTLTFRHDLTGRHTWSEGDQADAPAW